MHDAGVAALQLAVVQCATADEPVKWGFTPVFLPNTCTLVTKLDADGVVRTRYEDGRQSSCDPETFDDK